DARLDAQLAVADPRRGQRRGERDLRRHVGRDALERDRGREGPGGGRADDGIARARSGEGPSRVRTPPHGRGRARPRGTRGRAASRRASPPQDAAIIGLAGAGRTAGWISKYRPRCPILGVSHAPAVVRAFAMNWGVTGVLLESELDATDDQVIQFAVRRARE